jgi:hypothetical protein
MNTFSIVGQVATIIAVASIGGAILLALWHLYKDAREAMQASSRKDRTIEALAGVILDDEIFGHEAAPPQITWPEIPETKSYPPCYTHTHERNA